MNDPCPHSRTVSPVSAFGSNGGESLVRLFDDFLDNGSNTEIDGSYRVKFPSQLPIPAL